MPTFNPATFNSATFNTGGILGGDSARYYYTKNEKKVDQHIHELLKSIQRFLHAFRSELV